MANSCNDIPNALRQLENAINAQSQCCNDVKRQLKNLESRIGALEKGNKGNPSSKKQDKDLESIFERLKRLESYCLSIESTFKNFATTIKQIKEIFLG